jgi:hypothetical protein
MAAVESQRLPWVARRGRETRALEDRIAVRFPGLTRRLYAWLTPLILRMPRQWRLRQRLIEWSSWRSNNAFRRGDLELLRVLWHPDCTFDFSRFEGWVGDPVYHGHEGLAAFVAEWGDAWGEGGSTDVHAVEDFGGGVFVDDHGLRGVGRASGAAVGWKIFAVVETRGGLIWRAEYFGDRAQAVETARAGGKRPSPLGYRSGGANPSFG